MYTLYKKQRTLLYTISIDTKYTKVYNIITRLVDKDQIETCKYP